MDTHKNTLLFDEIDPVADVENLSSPTIFRRSRRDVKRDIRDARRSKTAAEAIGLIEAGTEIYGFTKGQFSIIDILRHLLGQTGPAAVTISTWTAAHADVRTVIDFVSAGLITRSRWLVDLTFTRRSPELAKKIRDTFGPDAIRVCRNHAKFALIDSGQYKLTISTSMNLNFNPRFENFFITDDPKIHDFHATIIDEIWGVQRKEDSELKPYDIHKQFRDRM